MIIERLIAEADRTPHPTVSSTTATSYSLTPTSTWIPADSAGGGVLR